MKKFLLLALLLTAITLPARAEQPAAEEYRQMFRSGTFFVEYQMSVPNKVATTFNGTRIRSPKFTLAGLDGNAHGANHIIQGTVINMGNGVISDDLNRNEFITGKTSGIAIETHLRIHFK